MEGEAELFPLELIVQQNTADISKVSSFLSLLKRWSNRVKEDVASLKEQIAFFKDEFATLKDLLQKQNETNCTSKPPQDKSNDLHFKDELACFKDELACLKDELTSVKKELVSAKEESASVKEEHASLKVHLELLQKQNEANCTNNKMQDEFNTLHLNTVQQAKDEIKNINLKFKAHADQLIKLEAKTDAQSTKNHLSEDQLSDLKEQIYDQVRDDMSSMNGFNSGGPTTPEPYASNDFVTKSDVVEIINATKDEQDNSIAITMTLEDQLDKLKTQIDTQLEELKTTSDELRLKIEQKIEQKNHDENHPVTKQDLNKLLATMEESMKAQLTKETKAIYELLAIAHSNNLPDPTNISNIPVAEDLLEEEYTDEILQSSSGINVDALVMDTSDDEVVDGSPSSTPVGISLKKKRKKKSPKTDDERKRIKHPLPEMFSGSLRKLDVDSTVELLEDIQTSILVAPGQGSGSFFSVYAEEVYGYIEIDLGIELTSTDDLGWLDLIQLLDKSEKGQKILENAGPFGVGNKISNNIVGDPGQYGKRAQLYKSVQNKGDINRCKMHSVPLGPVGTISVILFDSSKQYGLATETQGNKKTYAWVIPRQTEVYKDAISTVLNKGQVPASFNKEYEIVANMYNMSYNFKYFMFHLVAYLYNLASPVTFRGVKRSHKKPSSNYDPETIKELFPNSSAELHEVYLKILKQCHPLSENALTTIYKSSATNQIDWVRKIDPSHIDILVKYVGEFN